jgi:hypothetical protein
MLLLLTLDPAAAFAAPAAVIRDEGKPALSKLETGGWSAKIGFSNLTDSAVRLSVESITPPVSESCTVQFDTGATATLKAAQHEAVTVTYSQGCTIGKTGAEVRFGTGTTASQTVEVGLDPPSDAPSPDWSALWAFPAALLVSAFVLWVMLKANDSVTFGTELPHLPTTWSFKESWASNVTAGVAVVSGVVGSTDVVKAFLGEQAEASIALATVAATVALAFLGLGALLVQTAKHIDSESPTAGGFVLGAVCTLAGAFGELFALYSTGRKLDMGGWQNAVLPAVIIVAIVLVIYAVISVRATLETGVTPPAAVQLSEGTVTAVLLARRYSELNGDEFNEDRVFSAIERRLSPEIKVSPRGGGGKTFEWERSSPGAIGLPKRRERSSSDPAPVALPKRIGAALL